MLEPVRLLTNCMFTCWPLRDTGHDHRLPHHAQHVRGPLRRFGIDRTVFLEAAQHADEWRARTRRGWQPDRRQCANDTGSAGSDDGDLCEDIAGQDDGGRSGWPRRGEFTVTHHSKTYTCPHCPHVAANLTWLSVHVQRCHPGQPQTDECRAAERQRVKLRNYRAKKNASVAAAAAGHPSPAPAAPNTPSHATPCAHPSPPGAGNETYPLPVSAVVPRAFPPSGVG